MKIVDLIGRDMIVPSLVATEKRAILEELATHIASRQPRIDRAVLSRVLVDRELLASTAIGEGVAIPHGKLAAVSEIIACLGRARAGVDFDAMDKQPTYLFFVLVAPESSTGAHLKALARISRVFKDSGFRRRLLDAPDAEGMFQVIAEEDAKY
jgi:PTS system nitrogen regulatory IIA component